MIKFLNKLSRNRSSMLLTCFVKRSLQAVIVGVISMPVWSIDVGAAEQLAKDSGCTKCHAVDKKKDGPAYRDVAAKFRGTPDAEAKIIHHITSGEKVKFPDGHQEDHKKIKTKDVAEIKNLIAWILSLEGGTKY
ncbi:MAG: c-type cytochrome [Leptothrix ochracea]|uniref:c-type cytochrome n=1 Tax=Leptothrix ochracea TaxID=735331 RepID=UPI0034E2D626